MSSNKNSEVDFMIGLWIDNLMDRVRIEEHLKRKGFACEKIAEIVAALQFLQANPNAVLIIDLQNGSLDFAKMRQLFSGHPELVKRIGCYFPHVQIDLKKKMEGLGVERVFPRSIFFADSAAIVQKLIEDAFNVPPIQ